uniref:FAD binding / monooxygenase/ oxidoreductase/ oxidoreductase, acting on paired donors, with incorporation or reduction of molecular oxygen, NADH or NADPH as one donor, and incorporation of one atom... n=1 Tax=Arundo donax TaxID=35708 RepID=A0A0A9CVY6_ARUDO
MCSTLLSLVEAWWAWLLLVHCVANMPLTKHLRVAIIDSNPALKSRNYLTKKQYTRFKGQYCYSCNHFLLQRHWRMGAYSTAKTRFLW